MWFLLVRTLHCNWTKHPSHPSFKGKQTNSFMQSSTKDTRTQFSSVANSTPRWVSFSDRLPFMWQGDWAQVQTVFSSSLLGKNEFFLKPERGDLYLWGVHSWTSPVAKGTHADLAGISSAHGFASFYRPCLNSNSPGGGKGEVLSKDAQCQASCRNRCHLSQKRLLLVMPYEQGL